MMRSLKLFAALVFSCIGLIQPIFAADESTTKRYYDLTKEIRCVVCQNQNIADSNAPLAIDLRNKVLQMINDNKSNDEIKTYLVKRYGEFILLRPRFIATNFLLWCFPLLALSIAGYFLYRFSPKRPT